MWSTCFRDKNRSGSAGALNDKPAAGMGTAEVALRALWCYHTSKGMQNQMTPVLLDRCSSHCNLTSALGVLGPTSFYCWASTPCFPHSFYLFSRGFVITGEKYKVACSGAQLPSAARTPQKNRVHWHQPEIPLLQGREVPWVTDLKLSVWLAQVQVRKSWIHRLFKAF